MNICVFCSASDLEEKYTKPALEFAQLIGSNGHTLIWGGSDTGLMKVMASGVQKAGGKIVGVSVDYLKHKARQNADEMIITKDLVERKSLLLSRGDIIVMMVGGIGTLDEATEILELKKHKIHNKPIIILNSDNFYEGLKIQLQKMDQGGFLPRPIDELIFFADTPSEAINYINHIILR